MGMRGLEGQVAFVTGAGSGIGRATSIRLGDEGCRVVCADVNEASAAETAALVRGYAVVVDVSDYTAVSAAIKKAQALAGAIDLLVSCAGWDKVEPFVDSRPETWQRVVAVNLIGTINCVHAALPGMIERKAGAIVGVSSDAGRVGSSGEVVYSGAKAGVIGFLKGIARESARYNIRANIVCPGPTNTPMMQATADADPRIAEGLVKAIPFRRLGEPEEIASVIAFLLSQEASYITGQTLSVNGGLSML
jgi:2-hydroxycyclohexanecarboxyl-CoA dehydrogenase